MAGEDRPYLEWVRRQRCVAPSGGCTGPVQAHHAGLDRGLSQKAHDRTAIPLCLGHHTDWHGAGGCFRSMGREDRREWAREKIARTQVAYSEMPDWF